jgi:phosphoenolpyruvate-protein kinase (PTS system EI component)
LVSKIRKGDLLLVDGDMGLVMINPPEEVIQNYRDLQRKIDVLLGSVKGGI